ncbi:hypothetical protein CEXT_514501 [Caerostris extrusa]|uniref:Uncharacterized protein n=1 Tax=Caerostris extrusa TaxID=172846 RepID=A0AAV4UXV5_CAEEX|nr:hypothetical protein CEXT_514501 [Caerostris extrusa]
MSVFASSSSPFFCYLFSDRKCSEGAHSIPLRITSTDFSGRYRKMRVSDTEESDWSRPTVAMTTRARSDRPYAPRVAQNIAATLPGQISLRF